MNTAQLAWHPPRHRGGELGAPGPLSGAESALNRSGGRAHILPLPSPMAVARPSARTYTRRTPEQTVLYRVVEYYLPAFVAHNEASEQGGRLPAFVRLPTRPGVRRLFRAHSKRATTITAP